MKRAIETIAEDVEVMPVQQNAIEDIAKVAAKRTLPERIKAISEYHGRVQRNAQEIAMNAVMCGFELHAAKAELPHGEWFLWTDKNVHFSYRTVRRYMELAERISNVTRGHFADYGHNLKELAAGNPAEAAEQIKEIVEDKTLRQLYLDFGIIPAKPKGTRGGDHGGGAAMAAKARTRDASEEAREKAEAELEACIVALRTFVHDSHGYVSVRKNELEVQITRLKDLVNVLRLKLKEKKS